MSNPVLDNLSFDPDGAIISYKGIRYYLIRPETVAEIYRQIDERHGDSCRECFFHAGHRGNSLSLRAFAELGAPSPGEDLLAYMAEMVGYFGWGKVSSFSLDSDRREMTLEVKNSAFTHGQSDKKHPVCDALRGAFAAIGEALWAEASVTSEEVACEAMGDDMCRFKIAARD